MIQGAIIIVEGDFYIEMWMYDDIEEIIKENDEETLPGMGVFLEIIWNDSSDEMKDEMINIIIKRLKKEKEM